MSLAPTAAQRLALHAIILALVLFALLAATSAQSASACVAQPFSPTPLSNSFEGADGDQCDSDGPGAKRDWQNVVGQDGFVSTTDAPSSSDTIYGSNNAGLVSGPTDENVPDSWNFTVGNLGAPKYDALAAYSFTDFSDDLFVDLAFVRAASSGATFLGFELNQKQPGYRLDPNESDATKPFAVPTRSPGDLLVTYNVSTQGAIALGLCVWDGDEHAGRWEVFAQDLSGAPITNQTCPALSSPLYQAALNDAQNGRQGDIPAAENYIGTGTIGQGRFGEAVVNLTEALKDPSNPTGPQPCIDFGYVWMHSRSSDSLTSSQQDFILPAKPVSIGNCSVEGKKFNDANGDGDNDGAGAGEPYLGGWTMFVDYDGDGVLDNDKDATFVNDMDGIVEAGEEEPYAVTSDGTDGNPLGQYRITDVQTSASAPNGVWPVREILKSAWDCTAAIGAGAVATCPERTDTDPDTALGFQLAWTNNEAYSGRDFANKRRPATLRVIKDVVTDDGGTATAADWSLHVKRGATEVSGSPRDGSETGDVYTLTDGETYSVSETGGPSGYAPGFSGDCDADGSVTVAAGTEKTCTITNDDVAPTIKVVKHVVNDDGGSATAADWSLHLKKGGDEATGSPQSGSESGDTYTVSAGAFEVSETGGPSGYAASFSGDCDADGDVTVSVGQDKVCTITNDDVAPTIKVVKHVVNDDGGSATAADWSLHLKKGGDEVTGSPQSGSETGDTYTVPVGSYAASETGGPSGYAASFSGDCDADGDVTVSVGQDKVCTITNDDIAPRLTIVKHVVNKGGSNATASNFQMDVTATDASDSHFPGTEAGKTITLDAGAYSVDESGGPSTFAKDLSADCAGTIAIGTEKTCTITNTKVLPGGVVVKKGAAYAYHGDTLTFTFEVTNPGTTPLTAVTVTDDTCAPVAGPSQKLGGNQDGSLEAGEVWVYTCTMKVPEHTLGDASLVNVVTLSATDADGEPVTDSDSHTTRILHPAIAIDKTGPATAQAGSPVTYGLAVTNPGDVPFLAPDVNVSDPLCEAPPLLLSKNGDATPDQFDPGDSWTYGCRVQTLVGQTQVENVGSVTAKDSFGGRSVTDSDPAVTQLTQPAAPPPPDPSAAPAQVATQAQVAPPQSGVAGQRISAPVAGTARLSGPNRCVTGPFRVKVTGRSIAKVAFSVDGKKARTVNGGAGRTVFGLRINPRGQSTKAHRVTARVTFRASTGTRARTLRYVYLGCRSAVRPQFTG